VNPLASWGQFLDVDDAHPTVFIRRLGGAAGLASGAARWEVLSHDDTGGYRAVVDETANAVTELWRHELDHVPVTRLVGARDLEGEPEGRVVPLRDAQDRVNETVFALLMAQAYQSFRQRWAVGVTELNVSPAVDRVWTTAAGKETAQFGEFQAADLSNLVGAVTSALSGFAAVATLPPQNVLGLPSNVSADGLAAAEQAHSRMRDQWQRNMGEGWETLVRDLGDLAGDDAVAADHASQVRWEPTEARSFATVVDGLVKLTAGERPILPVEVALDLVPGLSTQDRSRARRLLRVQAPSALATLAGQAAAAALPDPATLLGL
jgi:HAMP domain-containing protein